jgi:hypothetical protein
MARPYSCVNEVQSTLSAEYIHGTHTTISLVSAANFPAGGGYIRVGIADAEHWALLEYTGKSTNDLTGIAPATLGVVETEAAYTYPVGTVVFRDVAGEDMRDRVAIDVATTAGFGFVIDEDNMSSNLDTKLPTQQSVKAYVDTGLGTKAATAHNHAASEVTSGTLAVAQGGTNLASGTSGGVLAYTATGVLASSAALAQYGVVVGGGAGVVPKTIAASSTTTQALFATATDPAFRAIAKEDLPSGLPVVLFRENTVTTVGNTATETSCGTYAMPGGTLGTTGILRVRAYGTYIQNNASATTLTFKLYLGTTAYIATAAMSMAQAAETKSWQFEAIISAVDSNSAQEWYGRWDRSAGDTDAGTMLSTSSPSLAVSATNNSAENSANALDVKLTIKWNAARAEAIALCNCFVIEKL